MQWPRLLVGRAGAGDPGIAWALGGLAVVAVCDLLISVLSPPYAVLALLDEPAHLSTAVVLLWAFGARAAFGRWRGRLGPFVVTALVCSVLIDVDHAPEAWFGWHVMTRGTPRPYTHSLLTVAVLLLAGGAARSGTASKVLLGAATGVGLHLWRDVATAPVALAWPVSSDGVQVPYWAYAASLVLAVAAPTAWRAVATRNATMHKLPAAER